MEGISARFLDLDLQAYSKRRKKMKTLMRALMGLLLSLFLVAPVIAVPSIDFGTGDAGVGGTLILFSDGSMKGVAIPVDTMTVQNAPQNSGTYELSGAATSTNTDANGAASLDFATGGLAGTNFITITGDVVGSGTMPNIVDQVLLTGTISSFVVTSSGNLLSINQAVGADEKSEDLLRALGLLGTGFTFFGFSISSDAAPGPVGTDITAEGPAISTDFTNSGKVPEPMSLILLGGGLAGAGLYRRLRRPKG